MRGVVVAALLVAGCIKVQPADGVFVCGTGAAKCPNGYYCAANNTCYRMGDSPDLAAEPIDMSMPDLPPLAPSCTDGVVNGDETDIDCGGASCQPCKVNQACLMPRDCLTGSCIQKFCQLVSDSPKWITMNVPALATTVSAECGYTSSSDGLLVTMGGITTPAGNVPGSVVPYKPGTGVQAAYASDPHPRTYAPCLLGPGGRVFYVGGYIPSVAPSSVLVDAFDPVSKTWSASPPAALTIGRRHHGAAFAGGKLYVFGGYDPSTSVIPTVEVYNPGPPDSWTKLPHAMDMPTPRITLAVTTGPDGLIYTIGGGDTTGTVTPSVEIFSPATGTWKAAANLSAPRSYLTAITGADGRIYAIGGSPDNATQLTTVEAYTPATNTWVPAARLVSARSYGTVLVGADNRLYYFGGDSGGAPAPTTTVQVYGPTISAAPGTGTAGVTNVSIFGSNFAANAVVDVFFGDRSGAPVASGSTDSSGSIAQAISFILPAKATHGSAEIFAVDRKSQYPAVATFIVE